jgi:hypothetical protein
VWGEAGMCIQAMSDIMVWMRVHASVDEEGAVARAHLRVHECVASKRNLAYRFLSASN